MTVHPDAQTGLTLIELILSMVIISIAITGLFGAMTLSISHSSDPMVQHQAIAIAESYLEEIILQAYADPDGNEVGETRSTFDDVDDYNGLTDNGVHNQQGLADANLSSYVVSVTVSAPMTLADGVSAKKIKVTVSSAGISPVELPGFRMAY
ncbi:MAG: prepilin-type N-terminal cleavage/methylation domain-containing protein [Methylomicrobium sp.]|nr:prepilin-type N-terminal cleavage/methylation domain-containing protein [Methylomicrobium sp.]